MKTKINMKQLLIIFIIVLGMTSCAVSQPRLTIVPRGNITTLVKDERFEAVKNFTLPRYQNLASVDLGYDYDGSLIFNRQGTALYYRVQLNPTTKVWWKIPKPWEGGGGGGISGVTSFNGRLGPVNLIYSDIVTTLGFTPVNPNGLTSQYIRGDGTKTTFPTIPLPLNAIPGTGISITGSYPDLTFNATGGGGGGGGSQYDANYDF